LTPEWAEAAKVSSILYAKQAPAKILRRRMGKCEACHAPRTSAWNC